MLIEILIPLSTFRTPINQGYFIKSETYWESEFGRYGLEEDTGKSNPQTVNSTLVVVVFLYTPHIPLLPGLILTHNEKDKKEPVRTRINTKLYSILPKQHPKHRYVASVYPTRNSNLFQKLYLSIAKTERPSSL
ncbi:MAG: hypothetical protein F6K39_33860 [Okeania sp. SIO3B3]|nr:hypothetical protein [Okeania sp. SIO3B3]